MLTLTCILELLLFSPSGGNNGSTDGVLHLADILEFVSLFLALPDPSLAGSNDLSPPGIVSPLPSSVSHCGYLIPSHPL